MPKCPLSPKPRPQDLFLEPSGRSVFWGQAGFAFGAPPASPRASGQTYRGQSLLGMGRGSGQLPAFLEKAVTKEPGKEGRVEQRHGVRPASVFPEGTQGQRAGRFPSTMQ